MKLFVIWTDKSPELVDLMLELKKNSHEIVYWLGYDDSEAHRLPGTIFHCYQDIINGKPARGVDDSEFPPVGPEIIKKLYHIESLAITMMNRIFPGMNIDKRKHRYYNFLRYWSGVLKKYRPDAVIFSDPPHFTYDFILYELARLSGIKTLLFLDTRIPGRLLPMNDFFKGSEHLQEELERNRGKNFSLGDLSADLRNYYEIYSNKNFNVLPPHVRYQRGKYSFFLRFFPFEKIKESIKNGCFFKKIPVYFSGLLKQINVYFFKKILTRLFYFFVNNSKKEYGRFQIEANFDKNFVYVPLQVQPECSTSPQGDMFSDQILMLEILSAALPDGWRIYAKEHPIQWLRLGLGFSDFKYQGYYQKIASIKNVRLVPINANSYDLIKSSKAVATVSGSAAWEGILRYDKPAIIFGYPWYKDCPAIFRVYDTDSCREALREIENGFAINRQKIVNYLKCFDKSTIRGYIAASAGNESNITKSECMKNISDFIVSELKKF